MDNALVLSTLVRFNWIRNHPDALILLGSGVDGLTYTWRAY
ncbi:hypothetical protein SAMN05216167_106234 [Spirosoma endophyticum]|uniref:Uncharacterized protein n=1 Tax=Spirosoma endophyticum TaxID=662367 RepID=A0A1I1UE32_9BACT|nr:hypothetical protein SAMN05216167_106234 [Spirosoma endophyticum]